MTHRAKASRTALRVYVAAVKRDISHQPELHGMDEVMGIMASYARDAMRFEIVIRENIGIVQNRETVKTFGSVAFGATGVKQTGIVLEGSRQLLVAGGIERVGIPVESHRVMALSAHTGVPSLADIGGIAKVLTARPMAIFTLYIGLGPQLGCQGLIIQHIIPGIGILIPAEGFVDLTGQLVEIGLEDTGSMTEAIVGRHRLRVESHCMALEAGWIVLIGTLPIEVIFEHMRMPGGFPPVHNRPVAELALRELGCLVVPSPDSRKNRAQDSPLESHRLPCEGALSGDLHNIFANPIRDKPCLGLIHKLKRRGRGGGPTGKEPCDTGKLIVRIVRTDREIAFISQSHVGQTGCALIKESGFIIRNQAGRDG